MKAYLHRVSAAALSKTSDSEAVRRCAIYKQPQGSAKNSGASLPFQVRWRLAKSELVAGRCSDLCCCLSISAPRLLEHSEQELRGSSSCEADEGQDFRGRLRGVGLGGMRIRWTQHETGGREEEIPVCFDHVCEGEEEGKDTSNYYV